MDRLSIRKPPGRQPVMYQTWGNLLFLHWQVAADRLRRLLPPGLELDTWEGSAWIGITPFTMWDIRPAFFPSLPGISRSHELNVRTYVHAGGIPGIWFLSLDASNALAVLGARLFFGLPYYEAKMQMDERNGLIRFASRRSHSGAPAAEFSAAWRKGERIPELKSDSLDFFLIERYCLYTMRGARLYRGRIHHKPWPLQRAQVEELHSTMLKPYGLRDQAGESLVHAQAAPLRVRIWALEEV